MATLDWSKLQLVTEYSPIDPSNPESVEIRAAQLEDTARLLLEIQRIKSRKRNRPSESDEEVGVVV